MSNQTSLVRNANPTSNLDLGAPPSSSASASPEAALNLTPPRGSHVEARAKGVCLDVEIGGTGFLGRGTRHETAFWTLWTGHLTFVTTRLSIDGVRQALVILALVMPFWAISVYLAVRTLFGMYGSTNVQLDERSVVVERRLFGWRRTVSASLRDWAGARVTHARSDRPAWTHCELALGIDAVQIGQRLSHAEQQWLAELLNAWVARLRNG